VLLTHTLWINRYQDRRERCRKQANASGAPASRRGGRRCSLGSVVCSNNQSIKKLRFHFPGHELGVPFMNRLCTRVYAGDADRNAFRGLSAGSAQHRDLSKVAARDVALSEVTQALLRKSLSCPKLSSSSSHKTSDGQMKSELPCQLALSAERKVSNNQIRKLAKKVAAETMGICSSLSTWPRVGR
jgi:hypothetical protein